MKNILLAPALVVALVGSLSAATMVEVPHFALINSSPEAESTVESPSEIRLWFAQEPQEGTTSIRLVEAEDAGVHVTQTAQDTDDPTSFYVELHGTLPPGTYTVSWRGMGQDGHVVRDSFAFTLGSR